MRIYTLRPERFFANSIKSGVTWAIFYEIKNTASGLTSTGD